MRGTSPGQSGSNANDGAARANESRYLYLEETR